MSETVVVKQVGEGRAWNDLTFFDVLFDRNGSDFEASWGKKGDPPQTGEQVEGEFFQKDGNWRFRKASKPPSGSREATTGTAGSKNTGSNGRDDVGARIERQAALKVLSPSINAESSLTPALRAHIEELESFIGEAGQKALAGQVLSPPVDKPAQQQPPADVTVSDIEQALDTAGLVDAQARSKVTAYMVSGELKAEKIIGAARTLTGDDIDAQGAALDWLKAETVKWSGAPLPSGAVKGKDEDDIPFARPEYPPLFSERERRSNRP